MKHRWLSLALAALMLVAVATACNNTPAATTAPPAAEKTEAPAAEKTEAPAAEEPGEADALDFVTLDWYIGLTPMPDDQMVNDAMNAYLKEKVNANVNIYRWTGQEIETTLTTMINGGQDVGIIGFGSQTKLDYVVQSNRGSYYALDDLLPQYGTGTKALFNDAVWKSMEINGSIYGIPSLKDNCYIISLIYNAEMADALGVDMSNFKYKNWRELEPFFMDVVQKRSEQMPEWDYLPLTGDSSLEQPYNFAFDSFLNDSFLLCTNLPGVNDIAGYDTETVFNFYATPEYKEFALQRQRLTAANVTAYDYTGKNPEWNPTGGMFAWVGWGYTYMQEHLHSDTFTTKMVVSDTIWTSTNNYHSAGTAISSNCANPERAMMILELVNTDPDFATMWRFGIEGEHYVINDEGKMQFAGSNRNGGDRADYGFIYWYCAPVGNLTIVRAPETMVGPNSIMLTEMVKYNNTAIIPSYMGFVFNLDPVANEIAACTNVVMEYRDVLRNGRLNTAAETEKAVDDFNAKLVANGVDKILAECQSQMDAWKASR